MPDVDFYADPTTTQDANTQKILNILPPIEELPPAPAPPISRPIDNHTQPHNTPPIQQQIQDTAQPYSPALNYDPLPSGVNVGAGTQLRTSNQIREQNLGVEFAMRGGQQAIGSELAYGLSWYLSGLGNSLFPNSETADLEGSLPASSAEGGFYSLGKVHADKLQDTIDNGKKILDDFREHPPHFEIPRPQIPKIELPQLPDFKLPELPEFKIPEFKFPEFPDKDKPIPDPKINHPRPKPVPKNLTRQLRELELSHCGFISFGYVRAVKVLGSRGAYNDQGGYYEERIQIPASIEEVYNTAIKYGGNEGQPPTIEQFIESSGQTGQVNYFEVDQFTVYQAYYALGGSLNSDRPTGFYPFNNLYYPYYSYGSLQVAVYGINNNSAINAILNKLGGGSPGEVYKINVSNLAAKDCPIGKPPPPPEEPPPPPDPDCDCMAQCCPDIDYRKIRAIIEEELKKLDLVAAIPISWQIRNEGNRPQLIIQSGEENGTDEKGNKKYKSAKYPISVPHWDGSPGDKISLPAYIKGNWEGIYTLSDNSKITINAKNEIECKRILNAIKPHISKQYLKDAYFKGGLIVRDTPIKESTVKPRYGRYFKEGQKNNKPDWRVDFT